MPDAEFWSRIWGAWKVVLILLLLVVGMQVLNLGFVFSLFLAVMTVVTVFLYKKAQRDAPAEN